MVNASGEDLEISLLGKEVELNVSHIELQKLKKTTRTWKSNFWKNWNKYSYFIYKKKRFKTRSCNTF